MHNLFINGFQSEWVNLFHFGRDKHCYNSNYVKFFNRNSITFICKVLIHDLYSCEVCLRHEFVWLSDFDHPIKHPCSQQIINVMSCQEWLCLWFHSFFKIVREIFIVCSCIASWIAPLHKWRQKRFSLLWFTIES